MFPATELMMETLEQCAIVGEGLMSGSTVSRVKRNGATAISTEPINEDVFLYERSRRRLDSVRGREEANGRSQALRRHTVRREGVRDRKT